MPDETLLSMALGVVGKPFNGLKNGNIHGNVCRILADEPVLVFDSPAPKSPVMVRLKPGTLVVAFSDPGELRQINTADEQFGYISRAVKLVPVPTLTPQELYDPVKRAEVIATLPPVDTMAPQHAKAESKQKLTKTLFMMGFLVLIILGFLYVALKPPPPVDDRPKPAPAKKEAKDYLPPSRN